MPGLNIHVILVGKDQNGWVEDGIAQYLNRLKHYCNLNVSFISPSKKTIPDEMKLEEGKLILQKIADKAYLILLDEKGKAYSSTGLADFLTQLQNQNAKQITFVIGGAYGFSNEVYKRANQLMALSALTFPHQLVRIILYEQLYRAFTILKGEGYHHQ